MLPLSWATSVAEIAKTADDDIGATRQYSVDNQVGRDFFSVTMLY
jgi:hypothetical protein